jgi:hypothetical protein
MHEWHGLASVERCAHLEVHDSFFSIPQLISVPKDSRSPVHFVIFSAAPDSGGSCCGWLAVLNLFSFSIPQRNFFHQIHVLSLLLQDTSVLQARPPLGSVLGNSAIAKLSNLF